MKKKWFVAVTLFALLFAAMLMLNACDLGNTTPNATETTETTVTETEKPTAAPENLTKAEIISAQSFVMNGQNLSLTRPNATDSFSFINQIAVSEKATWQISTDIYGINSIPTKTAPLNVGDNTFYLLVTSGDTAKGEVRY